MKFSIIELRELRANEGMVLTNDNAFSEVGGPIYLGKNDKAENWDEITEAEAEVRKKELEEQIILD